MQKATLLIGLLLAVPAYAQNPQPAPPTNPTPPIAPPNAASPPPERIAPGAGGPNNMSDRLSQQRGTITPPAVDPGMAVAPSKSGAATTPVIPPPGSPGGNPSVIPK